MMKIKNYTEDDLKYIIDNYQCMTNQEIGDQLKKTVSSISYVAQKLGLVKQPHKSWTDEEENFLKENYLYLSSDEIAKKLNRTIPSINARCKELNLIKHEAWTDEEIRYLKEKYIDLEHREIGKFLGRSEQAVRAKCFELGLYKKEVPWSEFELDFVRNNYMEMTTNEISEILNRTTNAIKLKAERMGMKKSPYYCNYHFFDEIDTEEKAYWLGFISADGWAYKNDNGSGSVGIELQYKDINHLKKFNISLGGNYRITDRWRNCTLSSNKEKLNHMCCIRIFSSIMCDALSKFGIIGNKTFNIQFLNLDDSLYKHYIRGLFDADGCFGLSNKNFKVGYITASEQLSSDLTKFVNSIGIDMREYKEVNSFGTVMYRPTINKNSDKIKFLDWIYEDANVYLDRKYKKYLKAKEKYGIFDGLAAQK